MRRLVLFAAAVGVALAAVGGAQAKVVKGQYIVVLEDDASAAAVATRHARVQGARVLAVYRAALEGYAARLTPAQLAAVRADPRVRFVERDRTVSIATTQTNAPWGLDRIDQRSRPLSTTFTYFATGAGVRAYVIDTGIRFSHAQFGGRAISGYDAVDGGSADDCNGHGTHVAGTIGGSTYGVAKGVTLVGVRVLGCNGSGTISGVIAGVNWVTANHQAGQPAVANMSLGGGASSALDTAVRNSIADGVAYAVAAGNGNWLGIAQNACNSSPARVGEAMTISATDSRDRKASWANYGSCVDWFAPGVSITSAWHTSSTATRTISGTSMATPHTAGVAALYLQGNPGASPNSVRTALYNLTTKGVVTSSSTANNHLLFTNF
ncbi:MAG TPA: S8 family peptidase [Gaiellaceae bacterium]|nr:S8 family peptidase [Gaiellaceae bacterium]